MSGKFKFDERKMDEVVFDFIYEMALIDATRHTEAAGLKNEVIKKDEIRDCVKTYADNVINGKETSFWDCVNNIQGILKKKKITGFTFGNIQKLINMTMKYLYIRYYDTEKAKNFNVCDAPMDSIVRDRVKKYYKDHNMGKPSFAADTAWSKMGSSNDISKYKKDNYTGFQKAVNKVIEKECGEEKWNKMEFDYRIWSYRVENEEE